ncbi:ribonuclease Z [Cryptococcus deuterogattii MMRL2647]|nr:ribonuclease Z [Cryptococcus deuterogattii MMRL2647]
MISTETYQPNWAVRAVTTPTKDTDLCLYVSFDNVRFLFGCGEGTQRAFAQKKIGFSRLGGVFIGSGELKGRGGLPGVLMSASDAGISKIDVIGPPDISQYLATLRSSVIRDALTVNVTSYPRDVATGTSVKLFESRNITVHGVALVPKLNSSSINEVNMVYSPYDPYSATFQPSHLSPSDLQKWCDHVVRDMFQNNAQARLSKRAPSPTPPPTSPRLGSPIGSPKRPRVSNVFLAHDGTINAARPDPRAPLPLPSDADVETQMVYICQAPDVRGKFDVAKATALGVPNGPLRGKLTRGESIEVSDPNVEGGIRVVKPEDCLIGGGKGGTLVIVNCTEKTLQALLDCEALRQWQKKSPVGAKEGEGEVDVMVHRVPRSVWVDKRYQAWMQSFGEKTKHLIANTTPATDHAVFNSAAWNTLHLSLIEPTIFHPPFLRHPSTSFTSLESTLPSNVTFIHPNDFVKMYPPSPLETFPWHEKDLPFTVTENQADDAREKVKKEKKEYGEVCEKARNTVRQLDMEKAKAKEMNNENEYSDDIVVTTLGTGSAIPSKYRNVSSTHLAIPSLGGILLDAGEGTLGQLRRRFGDGLKSVLGEMKMVFVSHMHADHHLGVNAVLEERFRLGITTPLYIVAPYLIALSLQETATWQAAGTEQGLKNVRFLCVERLGERMSVDIPGEDDSQKIEWTQKEGGGKGRWPFVPLHGFSDSKIQRHYLRQLFVDLGLTAIYVPSVPHRGRAYGLVLEGNPVGKDGVNRKGWKIVYSGDTKPSQKLVEAGKGATLLIHEATLEDDKPEVAAVKGHSTFSQAINVGKEMGAKYILLNHFSQRYPKLPKLPMPTSVAPGVQAPSTSTAEPNGVVDEIATLSASSTSLEVSTEPIVSISFDFMSLRLGDMWKMPYYMEGLSMLFAEPEDGEDVVEEAQATEGVNAGGKEKKEKGGKKDKGHGKESAIAKGSGGGKGNDTVVTEPALKSKRSLKKEAARAIKAKAEDERVAASMTGVAVGGVQKEAKEKRAGSPGLEGPDRKRRSTDVEGSGVEEV